MRILIILFLILCSSHSFAKVKKEKIYKHEIGISIFRINASFGDNCASLDLAMPMQSILSSPCYWGGKMHNSMTPELYYSYQFLKRFKLRTSLANFTYSQSQSDIFYPYFSIYKRTNFSLGIQWEFKKKKNWNFYAGASALFVRQQDLYMRRISDLEIETMHSDIRHMLRPVALLGARFKLSPRFSASAESSINIRISPLSRLSINYHF